jgi:hypothetical protein
MTSGLIYADKHPEHWYLWYYLSLIIPEEAVIMGYGIPTWDAWKSDYEEPQEDDMD